MSSPNGKGNPHEGLLDSVDHDALRSKIANQDSLFGAELHQPGCALPVDITTEATQSAPRDSVARSSQDVCRSEKGKSPLSSFV